jgi:hypothetical protein
MRTRGACQHAKRQTEREPSEPDHDIAPYRNLQKDVASGFSRTSEVRLKADPTSL